MMTEKSIWREIVGDCTWGELGEAFVGFCVSSALLLGFMVALGAAIGLIVAAVAL